jgi:hypothetical protein
MRQQQRLRIRTQVRAQTAKSERDSSVFLLRGTDGTFFAYDADANGKMACGYRLSLHETCAGETLKWQNVDGGQCRQKLQITEG